MLSKCSHVWRRHHVRHVKKRTVQVRCRLQVCIAISALVLVYVVWSWLAATSTGGAMAGASELTVSGDEAEARLDSWVMEPTYARAYVTLLTGPDPHEVIYGVEVWLFSLLQTRPRNVDIVILVSSDVKPPYIRRLFNAAVMVKAATATEFGGAVHVRIVRIHSIDLPKAMISRFFANRTDDSDSNTRGRVPILRSGVHDDDALDADVTQMDTHGAPDGGAPTSRSVGGGLSGRNAYRRFSHTFDKVHIWGPALLAYQCVVYMDADIIVQRNNDEVFDACLPGGALGGFDEGGDDTKASDRAEEVGSRYLIGAVRDPLMSGFNSGYFITRPSRRTFARMLRAIRLAGTDVRSSSALATSSATVTSAGRDDDEFWKNGAFLDEIGSEQGFLNAFFRHQYTQASISKAASSSADGTVHFYELPNKGYNTLTGVLTGGLFGVDRKWWANAYDPVYNLHFVPPPKPYSLTRAEGLASDRPYIALFWHVHYLFCKRMGGGGNTLNAC